MSKFKVGDLVATNRNYLDTDEHVDFDARVVNAVGVPMLVVKIDEDSGLVWPIETDALTDQSWPEGGGAVFAENELDLIEP